MLLYLADIYRIGTFSEAQSDTKSEKHKDDKRVYVYTRKKMKVDGKNYEVLLVSRLMPRQDLHHYAIGKADVVEDSTQTNVSWIFRYTNKIASLIWRACPNPKSGGSDRKKLSFILSIANFCRRSLKMIQIWQKILKTIPPQKNFRKFLSNSLLKASFFFGSSYCVWVRSSYAEVRSNYAQDGSANA